MADGLFLQPGGAEMSVLATEWKETPGQAKSAQMPPVELARVLDSISEFLQRYVVFSSPAQPNAIALWVAHTWALDAFDYTPYLRVDSPEKQCGKSRVLDCLELITPKAWRTISPSEAVLFREIDRDRPTLLLDETDTLFCNGKDDRAESLRALLNAGFERKARFRDVLVKGAASQYNTSQFFARKRLPVSVRCQTPYATAVF
jgi:hypothetical protein